MKTHPRLAILAAALSTLLGACGGGSRDYKEGDTPRAAPATTPTLDRRPDSTTGVARSTGQPGAAGATRTRSSDISAPTGQSPDPKRP